MPSTALCLQLQRILPAAQHSLWLLVLRGIGIESRMHIENHVRRSLFDGSFGLSSALLAIFFGAALGNMVRGVPLKADHFFFEPLWTNFRTGADTGILDWYTCGTAVLALVALVVHGALYVALKTEGAVHEKSLKLTRRLPPLLIVLTVSHVSWQGVAARWEWILRSVQQALRRLLLPGPQLRPSRSLRAVIFLRAAADIVRFAGAEPVVFAVPAAA